MVASLITYFEKELENGGPLLLPLQSVRKVIIASIKPCWPAVSYELSSMCLALISSRYFERVAYNYAENSVGASVKF